AVQLVLTDEGQVRSAVVRTADGTDADAAREQEWCDAFDQARTRLSAEGVDTTVERLVPPGSRPAPRVRPRGAQPRRLTQARRRDRPE
ncbi:MAG TPA: response regulator receiver protein, partial [Trebonia sp.]